MTNKIYTYRGQAPIDLRFDQKQIRLELQTINSLLTALVGK